AQRFYRLFSHSDSPLIYKFSLLPLLLLSYCLLTALSHSHVVTPVQGVRHNYCSHQSAVVTGLHAVCYYLVLVPLYPVQLVSLPLYGYLLRFSLESDYLCLQALSAYSLVLVAYSPIQFSTARFLRLIALDLILVT